MEAIARAADSSFIGQLTLKSKFLVPGYHTGTRCTCLSQVGSYGYLYHEARRRILLPEGERSSVRLDVSVSL